MSRQGKRERVILAKRQGGTIPSLVQPSSRTGRAGRTARKRVPMFKDMEEAWYLP